MSPPVREAKKFIVAGRKLELVGLAIVELDGLSPRGLELSIGGQKFADVLRECFGPPGVELGLVGLRLERLEDF